MAGHRHGEQGRTVAADARGRPPGIDRSSAPGSEGYRPALECEAGTAAHVGHAISRRTHSRGTDRLETVREPIPVSGDTIVATGRFADAHSIFDALPAMARQLAAGVVSDASMWREQKVERRPEWARYDRSWSEANSEGLPPSSRILESLKRVPFERAHLSDWAGAGTALLVSELDDDIAALVVSGETDLAYENAQERFRETLSSFVDPYGPVDERPPFSYSIHAFSRGEPVPREFLSDATGID